MYKVLIVDDDFIICTGLQKLIDWEVYGFISKDYALNGLEALEMLEKTVYDLIITDIRMPKCDGIDLIKEIRQKNYPSKVIILSGYRDFEYAQTALEFGVKKYILKPVNEKILINTIIDIKNEIDESISQKLVLSESKTILLEKAIIELLKSENKNSYIYTNLENMGVDLKNKIFQVCIIDSFKNSIEAEYVLGLVLKKTIVEIVKKYSAGYTAYIGDNKYVILFCSDGKSGNSVKTVCEEIFNYVNKFAGSTVNISIGNEVTEYYMIYQSFYNAASLSSNYFTNENQHILFYDDIVTNSTIEGIIKYVRENCCEKLTLQSIANRFFFNPAYIGRIFKSHTGLKFNDFLIECKIEKSEQLLENSKYKVSEIAEKVGYTDYDHFCKVFKSKKGCSPSEYKVKNRTK